jgi:hypothetical protein
VPVTLLSKGHPFPVWVSTRAPWHWLPVVVQFREPGTSQELIDRVEPALGSWYLAGFNGEFGDKETGRFHYVTDPDTQGSRSVTWVVDLGRAKWEAIGDLLRKLGVLHDRHPIQRVLFGEGRVPEDE